MGVAVQQDNSPPPQGALRQRDGSVVWRIWAPFSAAVSLITLLSGRQQEIVMAPEGDGYFSCRQPQADEGLRYSFRLVDGRDYPDPASRWQPDGVHRYSALFSPELYSWHDAEWHGVARDALVIYELHVGTFTPEGTLAAIIPRLPQLASLGVTAVELMPVAQFPGDRNWGYDAVHPYAVQNSYGGPVALQRFVDAAHQVGLAVILDVVYNHFGPEGNYLGKYGPYFTDRFQTPWGMAVNYDGPDSDPVRQFVIDNACAWVRDFHIDGLRLDAVQTIFDLSPRHILAEIQAAVQREAVQSRRIVHVIAESNQNDVRLIRSRRRGGYGLDGVWSDDFHHSIHTLLTGEHDGYYVNYGEPSQLVKAINDGFAYDGCYSAFHRRRHGSRAGATDRTRFVVFVQNHDQVGNRARSDRLAIIVPPAAQRLACGLLLLSPNVPLLFMGEEYGELRPFPFFCSFGDLALADAVRRGRLQEFSAMAFSSGSPMPDPQDARTFSAAKLTWEWPEGTRHAQLRQLYQDLLAARRGWSVLQDRRHTVARLANDSSSNSAELLVLQRGGADGLLAVANLAARPASMAAVKLCGRELLLTTEDVRYGGSRALFASSANRMPGGPGNRQTDEAACRQLLPYELLVFCGNGGRP
jgi:maltooligosyltrehalose trehalohydrolase